MKAFPMRCKHCGSLLEATGGLMRRLFTGRRAVVSCLHCGKSCTREDATMMGYSFGSWIDRFIQRVLSESAQLPVIAPRDMAILLRQPNSDNLRLIPSSDALCSYLTHMFRPVLLEQAHGRSAEFYITGVSGEEEWIPGETRFGPGRTEARAGANPQHRVGPVAGISSSPPASADRTAGGSGTQEDGEVQRHQRVERGSDVLIAILGMVEEDRGHREWQAMVARVGLTQFIVYAPNASEGTVGFAMRKQAGALNAPATTSPDVERPAAKTRANLAPAG